MTSHEEQSEVPGSWTISVAFWLALLAAATAYAAVVISPKLINYIRLRHDYRVTQVRLVTLEHEASNLQQVVDSLERDPEFVRKLATVDFGAMRRGEDRIAVDEELQLSIRDNDPVFDLSNDALPWYGSMIEPFAVNQTVRRAALMSAATILILAFMFLQESTPEAARSVASETGEKPRALLDRYRRLT